MSVITMVPAGLLINADFGSRVCANSTVTGQNVPASAGLKHLQAITDLLIIRHY